LQRISAPPRKGCPQGGAGTFDGARSKCNSQAQSIRKSQKRKVARGRGSCPQEERKQNKKPTPPRREERKTPHHKQKARRYAATSRAVQFFIQESAMPLALVASQDGRFTVLSGSPCENMTQRTIRLDFVATLSHKECFPHSSACRWAWIPCRK